MDSYWKDIQGYEGLYQVSRNGEIRRAKILQEADNGKGYKFVFLCKNGKYKRFYIHRIVAETFIKNPMQKNFVNHKNGVRSDNRVENLEWITQSENERHKYRILGFVQKNAKQVEQIKNGKIIATYPSLHHAARAVNGGTKEIKACCIGKAQQAKGFNWKYKEHC